ncbi:MAG: restriction endonuclease subunit M, partial [Chloroflexi bacterium]|nr:restriction endonuclease subunit M [Chloroflexota bacterium]
LMFLDKAGNEQFEVVKVSDLAGWRETRPPSPLPFPEGRGSIDSPLPAGEGLGVRAITGTIPAATATAAEWNFTVGKGAALFERLSRLPVKLGDIAHIFVGLQTSADTVFLFKEYRNENRKTIEIFSKELNEWVKLEAPLLKRVIRSGSVGRYRATTTAYVLFPYSVSHDTATLLSKAELQKSYPLAWAYLERNKKLLESREKGAFKDSQWYRFGRNQNLGMWEQPKLLVPYMITELSAYPDLADNFYFINVTTGGYGITVDESQISYAYLCGLLNSRLLDFCLKQVSTTFHGGYFAANKQYIEQLPIRPINFSDPADKSRHDKMVQLVESMLALHKHKAAARTQAEQEQIQRQIDATDRQIDTLVYELYGLMAEEIAVVEGRG